MILYAALASVVPSTMYAVAVRRVMDIHLVLRKTIQHALARHAVWCLSLGPLALVALDIYRHRELTVTAYMGRERPFAFLLLSFVGFSTLTFRHQLLRAVDRWFLREAGDHSEALARLEAGFRTARSIRQILQAWPASGGGRGPGPRSRGCPC